MNQFEIPILFIIFNRHDVTERVFEVIRKIKPKYLFVAADGPRVGIKQDKERCESTRSIINKIDWECELKTLFRKENLGMKKNVSSAITWFFKCNQKGIIIEDDCLPNKSFFYFCEEMLNKYENNKKIMHISGNFFQSKQIGLDDYYFSHIPHIWGWATWRRAWDKYDLEMKSYPNFIKDKKLKVIFKNKKQCVLWKHLFDQVFYDKSDTWDFQWTYTLFSSNGLSITPNKNLVTNIGFGNLAENCKNSEDKFSNLELVDMHFPLKNSNYIIADEVADYYTSMNNFGFSDFKYILIRLNIFNLLQWLYRKIK
jgi:hypothetical protein